MKMCETTARRTAERAVKAGVEPKTDAVWLRAKARYWALCCSLYDELIPNEVAAALAALPEGWSLSLQQRSATLIDLRAGRQLRLHFGEDSRPVPHGGILRLHLKAAQRRRMRRLDRLARLPHRWDREKERLIRRTAEALMNYRTVESAAKGWPAIANFLPTPVVDPPKPPAAKRHEINTQDLGKRLGLNTPIVGVPAQATP